MLARMDLTMRKARRADLPDIVGLLRDDVLGRAREGQDQTVGAGHRRAFDAIHEDPRQLLIVAEEDGKVRGTLQVSFIPSLTFEGGERAQIEAVRVARGARGEGLGEAMLTWAIDQARDRGCHMVQLTTNKDRQDALRFYEALGFSATHEGMKLML